MSPTDGLKEAMFQEMKGRTKEDMSSAPFRDGPFDYYYRFETGAEHGINCRKGVSTGVEEILLDEDAASKGKPFYEVGCSGHSPDHENFAWCERHALAVSVAACPPPRSHCPAPNRRSYFGAGVSTKLAPRRTSCTSSASFLQCIIVTFN
jgi:hypothetical protein